VSGDVVTKAARGFSPACPEPRDGEAAGNLRRVQVIASLWAVLAVSGVAASQVAIAQNARTPYGAPLRSALDPDNETSSSNQPRALAGATGSRNTHGAGSVPYTPPPEEPDRAGRNRLTPNYGRPQPLPNKRLRYRGRRSPVRRAPSNLEPYGTAPRSVRARDPLSGLPPVQFAQPRQIPRRARPSVESNPYAPLGINMGSIRVLPFVELSAGYDDNAGRTSVRPGGSSLARIDAGFTAFSLWSRHRFTADVRAGYARYFTNRNVNRPDGSARLTL